MIQPSENIMPILSQVRHLFLDAVSPYNDGYVQAGCKRDLVMLKYELEKLVSKCPDFGDVEKQWDQELIIDKLTQV
jgi:hypothetical protein